MSDLEIELEKLTRHQRWLDRKDALHGTLHYGSEEELQQMSPAYLRDYISLEQDRINESILLEALDLALEKLRIYHPRRYEIVRQYYFSDEPTTMKEIAERIGLSQQAVSYHHKKSLNYLRGNIMCFLKEWGLV